MNQNNFISINRHRNLTNQFDAIEWIIDTTPDYNLTENTEIIYTISNVNHQFPQSIVTVAHNDAQFVINHDFIPFVSKLSINTDVHEIPLSEEERNCCICYEIKEYKDISQINCGHKFCGTCIIDHISVNYINPCCPLCREKIVSITFQSHCYETNFKNLMESHRT